MRICLIILYFLISIAVFSQQKRSEPYISPLNIPLNVSGSFGELRSNHFHSGIDLKTNEKTGLPVFSIADGYVSRIKISAYGFGKAIYVRHPNGFTSVYAHLDSLSEKYAVYLKNQHYKLQSFEIDIYPERNELSVKKGDIIAYSGNSGGSEGPHLHFEIRENATEKPVNPLLLGIQISDELCPEFRSFHMYNHFQNDNIQRLDYGVTKKDSSYTLTEGDTIFVNNEFSVGISAIDKMSDGLSINGIFNYSIYLDSTKAFEFLYNKFGFDESRYINAFIDYAYFIETRKRIQTSYIQAGNKLSMYSMRGNNGLISLYDTNYHNLSIVIQDFSGNKSELNVVVCKMNLNEPLQVESKNIFRYNRDNYYKSNNLRFSAPAGALYSNIDFISFESKLNYSFSKAFQIMNEKIPLHLNCSLSIKLDTVVDDKLLDKLCICSLSSDGKRVYEDGKYSDGWVSTKTRTFGTYYIDIDTIAPVIAAVELFDSLNISKFKSLNFKITDDLSGISKYEASIDGEWILMDYDAKNNLLTYLLDEHFPQGTHTLKLKVSDDKRNQSFYELVLIR